MISQVQSQIISTVASPTLSTTQRQKSHKTKVDLPVFLMGPVYEQRIIHVEWAYIQKVHVIRICSPALVLDLTYEVSLYKSLTSTIKQESKSENIRSSYGLTKAAISEQIQGMHTKSEKKKRKMEKKRSATVDKAVQTCLLAVSTLVKVKQESVIDPFIQEKTNVLSTPKKTSTPQLNNVSPSDSDLEEAKEVQKRACQILDKHKNSIVIPESSSKKTVRWAEELRTEASSSTASAKRARTESPRRVKLGMAPVPSIPQSDSPFLYRFRFPPEQLEFLNLLGEWIGVDYKALPSFLRDRPKEFLVSLGAMGLPSPRQRAECAVRVYPCEIWANLDSLHSMG